MSKKMELIQQRALEIAQEEINKNVTNLGDEVLEGVSQAIILTSANISARLLAEYDENKSKGNI